MIRSLPLVLAVAATCAVAAGCKPDVYTGDCDVVFGDPTRPIEIIPGQFKDEQLFEVLADGDPLDLRRPPQGGQVAYVGARVTNVVGCRVEIGGLVTHPASGLQFAREARDVTLVPVPGQPDLAEPEPGPAGVSNYANVPLCPNYLTEELYGVDALLTVTVTERIPCPEGSDDGTVVDGRTCVRLDSGAVVLERKAEVQLTVVPTCTERGSAAADANRALCECECLANYCLGRCADPPIVCDVPDTK